jgi:Protein of unknown function (DUF2950)
MKREMIYTINPRFGRLSVRPRRAMLSLAIAAVWAASSAWPGHAEPTDQQAFASAMEASKVLFEAVRANDGELIVKILGGPTELASSGDKNQDKLDRECFVQKYQEMHRMVREEGGKVVLYIGAENWPFPIPLLEKDGVWRFDAETGMKEILYRRVGENELTAIATCHEFTAKDHESGKPEISADSFSAKLSARATGDPALFHGYYFRVLVTRPASGTPTEKKGKPAGGSVLIAYPAEYRSSGVMTFVVTASDIVYEKDLGASTSTLASALTAFHKDASWHAAR